jgi:hypothetical protein
MRIACSRAPGQSLSTETRVLSATAAWHPCEGGCALRGFALARVNRSTDVRMMQWGSAVAEAGGGVSTPEQETIYRGFGFAAVRSSCGRLAAVLVTGLAFGLSHGLLLALPVLTFFGCMFCSTERPCSHL